MGFPSEGGESLYRNPMAEVQKLFEKKHKGHIRVYNLCAERAYPHDRFESVRHFKMADHNPSSLQMIFDFCEDAKSFMDKDPQNTIAVHCKAGKGRTGFMISALLVYNGTFKTAGESLKFFGYRRTSDGKGVTIPSQLRYVHYVEEVLARRKASKVTKPRPPPAAIGLVAMMKDGVVRISRRETCQEVEEKGRSSTKVTITAPERSLVHVRMHTIPKFDLDGGCDPYLTIQKYTSEGKLEKIFTSKTQHEVTHAHAKDKFADIPCLATIAGDCKLTFWDKDTYNKDDVMFWCWINSSMLGKTLKLKKMELDGAHKQNKKCFHEGFECELFFDGSKLPEGGRTLESKTRAQQSAIQLSTTTSQSAEEKRLFHAKTSVF